MSVNWDLFSNNLKSYFESYTAFNIDAAATYIGTQYDIAVKLGGDSASNNFVIRSNKNLLIEIIGGAFSIGMITRSGIYNSLERIGPGLIMYWTGAELSRVYPPPGTISVVSNLVILPGQAVGLPTPPTNSNDLWVDSFVMMAKNHLLTLSGQIVAMIPSSAGPVPITIPWVGYK